MILRQYKRPRLVKDYPVQLREKLINCKVIRGTICITFCIAFFIGIQMALVFFRLILHTDLQANLHYRINLCGVANWPAFCGANSWAESLLGSTNDKLRLTEFS